MVATFTYNFTDLIRMSNGVQSVLLALPSSKSSLLRNILGRYKGVIDNRQLTQNTKWTGTYEQSLKIIAGGSDKDPTMSLVLEPTGPQADRLGIYWKVLEFGANPSPNVLSSAIVEWATTKLGVGNIEGIRIANRIRSRGINPHPILSSIFILTPPDGNVVGLTKNAETIAEIESQKIMDKLLEIYINPRTGQVSARGAMGRFISIK